MFLNMLSLFIDIFIISISNLLFSPLGVQVFEFVIVMYRYIYHLYI